ncbi:MAG: M48 family metallopeptidase [Armatimonadetes bacterium]|nr:M48 family metallopeptidase [Armatimonadota bacterium]
MYEQISGNIWRSRLLLVMFLAILIGIGYVFSRAYNDPFIMPLAIVIAVATTVGSFYYSDKIVIATTGARAVDKDEFPHYVNSVEGIAIAAGLPCPRIFVINDLAPNAFATGRDPEHALICVTTGLLGMMDRTELEGVIGHEMSHIENYDIRFMMLVAVLAGSIALMSDFFWRMRWFRSSSRDSNGGGQAQAIFMIIGLVLAILAPLSAALVQAWISRQREYLADANGALLTRFPEGLANALEQIAEDPNKLQSANKATAHLFIANPLKDHGGAMNSLFDTHPPIVERVRRLREM